MTFLIKFFTRAGGKARLYLINFKFLTYLWRKSIYSDLLKLNR